MYSIDDAYGNNLTPSGDTRPMTGHPDSTTIRVITTHSVPASPVPASKHAPDW